ncbi:hypothetical protein MRX96_016547 [Rhipicephalus microplus]
MEQRGGMQRAIGGAVRRARPPGRGRAPLGRLERRGWRSAIACAHYGTGWRHAMAAAHTGRWNNSIDPRPLALGCMREALLLFDGTGSNASYAKRKLVLSVGQRLNGA